MSNGGIKVLKPGFLTTIQDLGRRGFQKYGVVVGGAMDRFAIRTANMLLENDQHAAALEITLQGPVLQFEEDALIAVCGADLSAKVDGSPLPLWRPVYLSKGTVLEFSKPNMGCRAYLAIAGGFAADQVMGSTGTYLRAELGGYQGRALKQGDQLEVAQESLQLKTLKHLKDFGSQMKAPKWHVSPTIFPAYSLYPLIRVIRGREYSAFVEESQKALFYHSFKVSAQSDRMGYRLEGDTLTLKDEQEMLSEAVSPGTIQVPSGGKPIILMADCQTTGGYPRIAQVAAVDLPVLAQLRPGNTIEFVEITLDEAQRLWLEGEHELQQLQLGIRTKWLDV